MIGLSRQRWILFLAGSLLLAGCASQPQKPEHAPVPVNATPSPAHPAPPTSNETGTPPDEQLPPAPNGMVGVPSCDQYLSTYKACHRAAGIFAPSQIETRYALMRNSLLRDARDPVKRTALDQRCRALSAQLQEALHGKSCNVAPASSASGG